MLVNSKSTLTFSRQKRARAWVRVFVSLSRTKIRIIN
jgi:hypothetical protein